MGKENGGRDKEKEEQTGERKRRGIKEEVKDGEDNKEQQEKGKGNQMRNESENHYAERNTVGSGNGTKRRKRYG